MWPCVCVCVCLIVCVCVCVSVCVCVCVLALAPSTRLGSVQAGTQHQTGRRRGGGRTETPPRQIGPGNQKAELTHALVTMATNGMVPGLGVCVCVCVCVCVVDGWSKGPRAGAMRKDEAPQGAV